MALTITQRPSPEGSVLLALEGAVAPDTVESLDVALARIVREGTIHVALDCAGVRYINSTGFATLVKHAQPLEAKGGGISLLGVPTKVRVVAEMLGLEQVFSVMCEKRPAGAPALTARR